MTVSREIASTSTLRAATIMKPSVRNAVLRLGAPVTSEDFLRLSHWEGQMAVRRARAALSPAQARTRRGLRSAAGLRVNLGCGPTRVDGWLHVDAGFEPDLFHDLGRPLPLPDGCARLVFTDHVLEHLGYPHPARLFLAEAHRILEPGGHLRVIVPDALKIVRTYAAGDHDELYALSVDSAGLSPVGIVNHLFRDRTLHKYLYDFHELRDELLRVGFTDVRQAAFRDSPIPELNLDSDTPSRRAQSLYVEATRPS